MTNSSSNTIHKTVERIRESQDFQEAFYCASHSLNFQLITKKNRNFLKVLNQKLYNLDKEIELNKTLKHQSRILQELIFDIWYVVYELYIKKYSDQDFLEAIQTYKKVILNHLTDENNDLLEIWKKFLIYIISMDISLQSSFRTDNKRLISHRVANLFSSYEFISIATFLIGIVIFILFILLGVV